MGAKVEDLVDASQPVQAEVALKVSDMAALQEFAATVSSLGSPEYRHYLVAAVGASAVLFCLSQSLTDVHTSDWIWIGLLAVVPAASHILLNWAHRHLDVAVQSVIRSAIPIVAALAAWVILGQHLNALQIAGGFAGVGAITMVAIQRDRERASRVEGSLWAALNFETRQPCPFNRTPRRPIGLRYGQTRIWQARGALRVMATLCRHRWMRRLLSNQLHQGS